MLTFEPPIYRVDGITVFRDHAQPELFYYTAPHPQLARQEGRLLFDLHAYTVPLEHSALAGTRIPEELGAGFLTMGVDCALDESRRRRIISGLAEQAGIREERIVLHPISYHKGRVKLLALDRYTSPGDEEANADSLPASLKGRPTFVERVLGSATPSLLGDLRAIFSLALSQHGVAFLEGLYRDGAAPVGVVYELDYFGLRPALDVRIHADLSRIYRHFGGSLGAGFKFIKAEVGAELDRLVEDGAIEIEITAQASGGEVEKSKELALSLFKDRIVQEMFRPTAPANPPQPSASGAVSLASLAGDGNISLTLKARFAEELKKVTYDFRERAPEERTHSPQGFLPVMLSPRELESRIHRINLQSDFFEILQLLVTGPAPEDFDRLGIRQIHVRLVYPHDEASPLERTLLFRRDSTGDKSVAFRRAGRRSLSYSYQVTYEFEPRPDIDADALRYELAPRATAARTLAINPFADFGLLEVQIETGRLHPDIHEVEAYLAYSVSSGFRAEERFRLGPFDAGFPPSVSGTGADPGSNGTGPSPVPAATHFDAAPRLPVTRGRWTVRTREQGDETYTATFTYYFRDGSSYTAPALTTSDRLLVVNSPFRFERRLLIRPNAGSEQTTAITVEVEYQDQRHGYHRRFLLDMRPPFASREIAWPILDPNHTEVHYRVTVAEPGFLTEGEWQTTDDTSILVGGPVSRHAQVQVRLVGAGLAEVGLDALLVKIAPTASDDSSGIRSLLFEPGQTAQDVTLLLPPGGMLSYRYQTTAFRSDGQVTESDWKESTSSLLVISTRSL